MAPDLPVPSGRTGILIREQELRHGFSKPLTPDEMWRHVLHNQRGFLSSPSGPRDLYRSSPAALPSNSSDKIGAPVGKGYETFAVIQVVDKDGRQVALGADFFDGGGPEKHGEARTIRGLERFFQVSNAEGGWMIVVTEKDPCPSCEAGLIDYGRRKGLRKIEIYMPERAAMTKLAKMVTGKTASRSSFQAGRPATVVKSLRTINIPSAEGVPYVPKPSGVNLRTAVVGTVANFAAAVLLGIVQKKFKDEMLKSLENMPKPKVDRRAAADYLADPNTGKALQLIDLLNKNLGSFMEELADHHLKLIAETNVEITLLAISSLPPNSRLHYLTGLQDQLQIYVDELYVVLDNVEAAKRLESKSISSAKDAEALAKLLDRALIADFLLKQGFSLEEIVDMYSNLTDYSSRIRKLFQQLGQLQTKIQAYIEEQATLASSVNKVYWHIVGSQVADELKRRAQP